MTEVHMEHKRTNSALLWLEMQSLYIQTLFRDARLALKLNALHLLKRPNHTKHKQSDYLNQFGTTCK